MRCFHFHLGSFLVLSFIFCTPLAKAEETESSKTAPKNEAREPIKKDIMQNKKVEKKEKKAKRIPRKRKKRKEASSTTYNFEETMLEGKMKVPTVSLLQGRVSQAKKQMIRLRNNFHMKLRKSPHGVSTIEPH